MNLFPNEGSAVWEKFLSALTGLWNLWSLFSQPPFEYMCIQHAVTFLNLFWDIKEQNCPFMLIHSFRKLLATSWKVCRVKLAKKKWALANRSADIIIINLYVCIPLYIHIFVYKYSYCIHCISLYIHISL